MIDLDYFGNVPIGIARRKEHRCMIVFERLGSDSQELGRRRSEQITTTLGELGERLAEIFPKKTRKHVKGLGVNVKKAGAQHL